MQGELATDYLSLRGVDAQIASLNATVQAYQKSLTIATNRYNAGVVARTDQFQAQSQLASAQSDLIGEQRTRAQFEDAIAVLVGENPASFTIPSLGTAWSAAVPAVPLIVPATLTQRRPDIASAERAVAAANAEIGVQRAAFFPTVNLTGEAGFNNDSLSGLFSSAASLWSLGASVAETLLDFGARKARVAQARAAYDAAVANYRQVTLTAFQEVQDDLIAVQVLARQEQLLRAASVAADKSEATLRNQYRAGLVVYTDVVTSQATALAARRALLQAEQDRQTAAVALVQALGGGWSDADLTSGAEAARAAAVAAGNQVGLGGGRITRRHPIQCRHARHPGPRTEAPHSRSDECPKLPLAPGFQARGDGRGGHLLETSRHAGSTHVAAHRHHDRHPQPDPRRRIPPAVAQQSRDQPSRTDDRDQHRHREDRPDRPPPHGRASPARSTSPTCRRARIRPRPSHSRSPVTSTPIVSRSSAAHSSFIGSPP